MCSSDLGKALECLTPLRSDFPDSAVFFTVLGDTYWEVGRYPEAIAAFRRATELAPQSELASLSLFHCLIDQGGTDAAFDEMRRFLFLRDSDEYRRLLREINVDEGAEERKAAERETGGDRLEGNKGGTKGAGA